MEQHKKSNPKTPSHGAPVVLQVSSTEEEILRAADPDATAAEIAAGMSGCVVHLCGCK